MGRKAFVPSEQQKQIVKSLSGFGIPQREIANHLRINHSTLEKYFKEEMQDGMTAANSNVVKGLYENCRKGNVAAQIFWCKTRLGWRETVEHTGADGASLIPTINVTIKKQE